LTLLLFLEFTESLFIFGIDWANHGICGRGVLLDLVSYYTKNGGDMPYDPWNAHAISVADLEAVAKHQDIQFRRGDILLLRVGFIQKYYNVAQSERDGLGLGGETL
jgi:hypothetical protein